MKQMDLVPRLITTRNCVPGFCWLPKLKIYGRWIFAIRALGFRTRWQTQYYLAFTFLPCFYLVPVHMYNNNILMGTCLTGDKDNPLKWVWKSTSKTTKETMAMTTIINDQWDKQTTAWRIKGECKCKMMPQTNSISIHDGNTAQVLQRTRLVSAAKGSALIDCQAQDGAMRRFFQQLVQKQAAAVAPASTARKRPCNASSLCKAQF